MPMRVMLLWVRAATCAAALSGTAPRLAAQWQANGGPAGAALGAVVGSDVERYVRALTLAGIVSPLPWGARPFGADELAELLADTSVRAHPWRAPLARAMAPRARAVIIANAGVNSAFPWGANDGPLWQGRGLTTAAAGALTFRWGPLTAVAAPLVFSARNTAFPLLPVAGDSPYRDGLFPTAVDRPQRMGGSAYARASPGESSVRLRVRGVVAGIATGSLGWGTGESFPAIFGANAGGFSHVFAGTAGRGLRVPAVGRFSGRYVLGVLEQSPWSPVTGSESYVNDIEIGTRRVGSGLTLSFMPSFLPTLELGASRFYHSPYTRAGHPMEFLVETDRGDLQELTE